MKYKLKKRDINTSTYQIVPLMLAAALVPLIVFKRVEHITDSVVKYYWTPQDVVDFFSYYKMYWFNILVIAGLIIFIVKLYKEEMKIKNIYYYIPAAVYGVFIIISTLMTEKGEVSLFGFTGRHEGAFVLLGYIIVMFMAANLVDDEKKVKMIMGSLVASATIIGFIGLLQVLNHNVLIGGLVDQILPANADNTLRTKTMNDFGAFFSTLSHYNYAGSYFAMLFPLSVVLIAYFKNKYYKIGAGIFSALMLVNLVGSKSRAGLVGGAFAALILLIMLRKYIIENWKYSIAIILVFGVLFGILYGTSGAVRTRIGSLMKDVKGVFSVQQYEGLKDLTVDKDSAKIVFTDSELNITYQDEKVSMKDEKGELITSDYEDNKIILKDDRYKDIVFTLPSQGKNTAILQMARGNLNINFSITKKDGLKLLNHRGQPVDLKPVEKWGFEGRERIGSARGYIWSRSIPLLKDTIIKGYGPDTFALYFPQDDYVGKLAAYDNAGMFVDKAHSLYLSTAINTGVISALGLIALFLMYFVSSFKIYFKCRYDDAYAYYGLAAFTAFCGYAAAGIFNDSVIAVAPVFWVLLGVGISINDIIKKRTA